MPLVMVTGALHGTFPQVHQSTKPAMALSRRDKRKNGNPSNKRQKLIVAIFCCLYLGLPTQTSTV